MFRSHAMAGKLGTTWSAMFPVCRRTHGSTGIRRAPTTLRLPTRRSIGTRRDLAVQPRDNELVLATHGRGIWIIDDITPWRALAPEILSQEVAFVSARPVQERIEGNGGWANGAAMFVGDNPPDAAVINYYQRERHLFGKLKIEVLDSTGRVLDEIPASKRPGLNRVTWSMREKPPRV